MAGDTWGFEPRPPAPTTTVEDGSITTAKLADGAVTATKLANLSPSPAGTYEPPGRITVDADGRITEITQGAGGGTAMSWAPLRRVGGSGVSPVWETASGSISTALQLQANQDLSVSGGKWYKPASSPDGNYKLSVWNAAGTRLASVTVSLSGTGEKTLTLATPQAISKGATFAVSIWDTSGNGYCYLYDPAYAPLAMPAGVVTITKYKYAAGDANPTADMTNDIPPPLEVLFS